MRFILVLLIITAKPFAVLKKRRFERNRDTINSAMTELELFDCKFIAQALQTKLDNHIWQECGIFADCARLVKRQIKKARRLCSPK